MKQVAPNYRGKGIGSTCCKGTDTPKRAGNFSYHTIHIQSLQSNDYRVKRVDGHLIVGEHTPLLKLMPAAVVELATNDPFFDSIVRKGTIPKNGKEYECSKHLMRFAATGSRSYLNFEFIYREEIYTDGEFDYEFPNY